VMSMPAGQVVRTNSPVSGISKSDRVQRLCAKCQSDRDKDAVIQTKAATGRGCVKRAVLLCELASTRKNTSFFCVTE
jgi:hypothetical protein